MKKILTLAAGILCLCSAISAQDKKDIVKTGLNFGPLPVVAYDADKGFQLGALLNIFNYGDGHNYPNYDSKWYFEASFYTKGSQLYQVMYDNKVLIPGVRWSSAVSAAIDTAMDFYGFNGYQSNYDSSLLTPFYRMSRVAVLGKSDFIGNITDNLKWEAGYHASWFKIGTIDYESINKGKADDKIFPAGTPTLYDIYRSAGIISDSEAGGGFNSSIRLGLCYDTRDKEGAPSSGIWAEAHFIAAPKWLGTTNPYYRYSLTWRHYVPIVKNDVLTFAYRLNYEGNIGNDAPFYVLPYITVMGENNDKDGMGGYRTARGILRDRVVGQDMATYIAELRWRFTKFHVGKQNIALGLSAFSDGTMVTRKIDISALPEEYKGSDERPHITAGAGFRFIMNENFIVAVEYGKPFNKQDGNGALYINTGYLF